jgi:TonB family protein
VGGSLVLHAVVLLAAIAASRTTVQEHRATVADTTLLFLPRLAPSPVLPAEVRHRSAGMGGRGDGTGNLVVAMNPPPKGFQTVLPPGAIPTSIPPVNPDERPFDPRDFTGRGVEGGVGFGVVGGTATVDPDLIPSDGDLIYEATLDDGRFEPAVLVFEPPPRYPQALQVAGISGQVKLRFVVDTTGRVDPESIKVLKSTHAGFEQPARESVVAALFHPARLGDRPVRQLTEQPIRFVVQ